MKCSVSIVDYCYLDGDPVLCFCFCRVIVAGEQKKLEGELQQIEEKHRAKKCRFAESSEQFYEQLARV